MIHMLSSMSNNNGIENASTAESSNPVLARHLICPKPCASLLSHFVLPSKHKTAMQVRDYQSREYGANMEYRTD